MPDKCPNVQAVIFLADLAKARNRLQTDQVLGLQQRLLEQHDQRRAACEDARIIAVTLQEAQRFRDVRGSVKLNGEGHSTSLAFGGGMNGLAYLVVASAAAKVAHHPLPDLFV